MSLSPQELLGLIMLGSLFGLIFVGFPVSFTLLLLAALFGYIGLGKMTFYLMVLQTLNLMKEETFAAVPLFIFMGHLLEKSGLMEKLFIAFQELLGGLRGSLYIGVMITCTIFATATGIIGASLTVIGLLAAPAMMRAKYDPALSSGIIAAGGCLGILIPPSVMLVVMGPILGVSVVHLFAAAIVPGLIMAGLYAAYALIRCYLNPSLGPAVPKELRTRAFLPVLKDFVVGVVPMGILIFASLGSILVGLATPTEAAAMGAFGAIILVLAYRKFNYSLLREASLGTLRTSSLILMLATCSNVFGSVFTRLGSASWLANLLLGVDLPPMVMLIALMIVIFILGWPLEWPAILFIFVPIFLPVVQKMEIDLVWYGALLAVNLNTAFLSPPVAMAAYYIKAIAPEWELRSIYNGMFQYLILQVLGLLIVLLLPITALWLPKILFGR